MSDYLHHLDGALFSGVAIVGALAACSVLDTLQGTAPWSHTSLGKALTMRDDHFDVFGTDDQVTDHGSTSDYWAGVTDAIAEAFAVTHSDAELPLLLTDEELDSLSEDVDVIPADSWDDAIADDTIRPVF